MPPRKAAKKKGRAGKVKNRLGKRPTYDPYYATLNHIQAAAHQDQVNHLVVQLNKAQALNRQIADLTRDEIYANVTPMEVDPQSAFAPTPQAPVPPARRNAHMRTINWNPETRPATVLQANNDRLMREREREAARRRPARSDQGSQAQPTQAERESQTFYSYPSQLRRRGAGFQTSFLGDANPSQGFREVVQDRGRAGRGAASFASEAARATLISHLRTRHTPGAPYVLTRRQYGDDEEEDVNMRRRLSF